MTKKETKSPISDYEIRVIAMKLATQDSRNCHSTTLVKLADTIYAFLTGKKQPKNTDE